MCLMREIEANDLIVSWHIKSIIIKKYVVKSYCLTCLKDDNMYKVFLEKSLYSMKKWANLNRDFLLMTLILVLLNQVIL